MRKIYLQKEVIGGSLNLFYGGLRATAPAEWEKSTPNISYAKTDPLISIFFYFNFFMGAWGLLLKQREKSTPNITYAKTDPPVCFFFSPIHPYVRVWPNLDAWPAAPLSSQRTTFALPHLSPLSSPSVGARCSILIVPEGVAWVRFLDGGTSKRRWTCDSLFTRQQS